MVLHCPFYREERERLRLCLRAYSVHAQWAALESDLPDDILFGLVLGVRPKMRSSYKHRTVAMSHCRRFLTTALRRRERLLASFPKPNSKLKKAKPEGADRSSSTSNSVEAKEPVGAVAGAHNLLKDIR